MRRGTPPVRWPWQEAGEDVLLAEEGNLVSVCGRRLFATPTDGAGDRGGWSLVFVDSDDSADSPFLLVITNLRLRFMFCRDENAAQWAKADTAKPEEPSTVQQVSQFAARMFWGGAGSVSSPPPRTRPAAVAVSEHSGSTPVLAPRSCRDWYGGEDEEIATYTADCVPLGMIDSAQLLEDGASSVRIVCRDMRTTDVVLDSQSAATRLLRLLNENRFSSQRYLTNRLAALQARTTSPLRSDAPSRLADLLSPIPSVPAEFSSRWRVTHINSDFLLCRTYPPRFLVPATASDELLSAAAAFRKNQRLPVVELVHSNGACIARSSQPRVGLSLARSAADEQLVGELQAAGGGGLEILDARGTVAGLGNAVRGGGVENGGWYGDVAVRHLGIDNIHAVRSSYQALHGSGGSNGGRWLGMVQQILQGAGECVGSVAGGASVLVHCSDGWDRTPQITALAALLLHPPARSLHGFAALVHRSWALFGHGFARRCGQEEEEREASPVFVQFVDCVWQLTRQFQGAFQFNETLLVELVDSVYQGRHVTLSGNSEMERAVLLQGAAVPPALCFWHRVLARPHAFLNPNYLPDFNRGQPLLPRTSPADMQFWAAFHHRWIRWEQASGPSLPLPPPALALHCSSSPARPSSSSRTPATPPRRLPTPPSSAPPTPPHPAPPLPSSPFTPSASRPPLPPRSVVASADYGCGVGGGGGGVGEGDGSGGGALALAGHFLDTFLSMPLQGPPLPESSAPPHPTLHEDALRPLPSSPASIPSRGWTFAS